MANQYDYKHLMRQYGGRLEPEKKGKELEQPEWIGDHKRSPKFCQCGSVASIYQPATQTWFCSEHAPWGQS